MRSRERTFGWFCFCFLTNLFVSSLWLLVISGILIVAGIFIRICLYIGLGLLGFTIILALIRTVLVFLEVDLFWKGAEVLDNALNKEKPRDRN